MRKQSGQTLIEVLIAFAVAGIIVTALTYASINSLKNSQFAKNQTSATQYSQEAIEIMHNMQLSNSSTFNSLSGTYCLAAGCTVVNTISGDPCGPPPNSSQCNLNVPSPTPLFIRQISILQNAPTCTGPSPLTQAGTEVTASVSWTDNQCISASYCHQVNTVTCITNYNQIPTP